MAIYRLEAKTFSREGKGRSVVAAAAYRTGAKLRDETRGKTFDYARRTKGVVDKTILTPDDAPSWSKDSSKLWNRVELAEKRVDGRLAREFVLAVPKELSKVQQFELVKGWVQAELVGKGMVAEIALHHPKDGKNPHAHIMTTTRKIGPDGFYAKKSREWNEKTMLIHWRKSWCDAENAALTKAGSSEQVDHRSLKDQGIDRIPEPKLGVAATAMKRRGLIKDPRKFQELRAVQLWNATRPVVKALASEYAEQGQNFFKSSIGFISRLGDVTTKPFRHLWRAFMKSHTPDKTKDNPELSR